MPSQSESRLDNFGICSSNGFLPRQLPLQYLPDPYYQPWEDIIADFPGLLNSQQLRSVVDGLPVLSIMRLKSEREQQRAYVILSFMTHGYIWGGENASEILPSSISIPFLAIADIFGLPTTATYAGLNLWNFAPHATATTSLLCNPDNLRCLCTFTGTKDEAWFYLISVAMEARGGSIITSMMRAMDAVAADNPSVVSTGLLELAETLQELGLLLDRMYEHCDPLVFYHDIRPFLAGSKNMEAAGLPRGVFYDEGEGRGQWRMYSGGSNAQSSLIQFFDIVLGIEHKAMGHSSSAADNKRHGFIQEMRRYMPASHAEFLVYVASMPSIRSYVISHPANHALSESYKSAVTSLGQFRDRHIQIVTRYIIIPSRTPWKSQKSRKATNLASVSLERENTEGTLDGPELLHGTGGTHLMPFLRQTRDETKNALQITPRLENRI